MKTGFRRSSLALALLLLFAACAPKTVIRSSPTDTPPSSALPGHKAADPQQALQKYTKHLAATKPGDPSRAEAWKHSVGSAVQLGEYDLAEQNLQTWKAENRNATSTWDWNQANAQLLLAQKGQDAYTSYLINLIKQADLDWTTRQAAGEELAGHFWAIPEHALAFEALGLMHRAAPDAAAKSGVESLAVSRADSLPPDALQKILDTTMGADPNAFPWSMVVWSQGMQRLKADKSAWSTVWPSLSAIVQANTLANKDFFASSLRALEREMGVARQNLVLLLPLSGPYSKVGWQIARGADCAWREGQTQSGGPEIKLINTESPTFLDELRTVSDAPIIGGPLRKDIWEKIRVAGLHTSSRFLTFLPNVENEGTEAWRFFSSPTDQARAVIQASSNMGVTSFAIMHPLDRFGTAMTQVFQDEAKALGVRVAVVRDYDENNPAGWTKAVAAILGASGDKNAMNPDPPFQAVFLADSLLAVQQLAPLFHYYEETRLLFLGPQLWTQNVADARLEMQYFGLAMFPSSWNPAAISQPALNLKKAMAESGAGEADLWAAQGYDFVRFTTLLGPKQDSAEAFNQALATAATRMSWSMAPMRWISGKASQDLFLFQPTGSGMIEADLHKMQATRAELQARRDARRAQTHTN